MTDEMDFKGVISVSDLGGIVLSYTKFSHCLNKFIQPPLKELDIPLVLGTQYDVNEVRD